MKRYIFILTVLLSSVLVSSCKEDTLDVYNGSNYIHFTPGISDFAEASYNFALDGETTGELSTEIPVEIRLWGYLPTEDFNCYYSVDTEKTTAVSSDYVAPSTSVFRKGFHVDTLWVKVNRREKLLETDYKITVKIETADKGFVVAPAKYTYVNIHVTDVLRDEPIWWGTTPYLGEYSAIKYRLFNIYLGKVLLNTDEYTDITFKEEVAKFKAWLKEKWDDGTYRYYDSDGKTPLHDSIPE